MTDLIIGIDDSLVDMTGKSSEAIRTRFYDLLTRACDEFAGLDVSFKLNVAARSLGHDCIETIEEAGFGLFLDYKLGMDVLDTMWADMRALSGFGCIQRLTFRSDCPVEFLVGHDCEDGACAILPNTSFLPVGPVTDLLPSYYKRRGFSDRRGAMSSFATDVTCFGGHVNEVICAPSDIAHFKPDFLKKYRPVTPAVRPVGLAGNEKNSRNAFTVEKAVEAGASAVVIASPIMKAADRRKAAILVLQQLEEADARKAT